MHTSTKQLASTPIPVLDHSIRNFARLRIKPRYSINATVIMDSCIVISAMQSDDGDMYTCIENGPVLL